MKVSFKLLLLIVAGLFVSPQAYCTPVSGDNGGGGSASGANGPMVVALLEGEEKRTVGQPMVEESQPVAEEAQPMVDCKNKNKGDARCKTANNQSDNCIAIAGSNDHQHGGFGKGKDQATAASNAINACKKEGGTNCKVVRNVCKQYR